MSSHYTFNYENGKYEYINEHGYRVFEGDYTHSFDRTPFDEDERMEEEEAEEEERKRRLYDSNSQNWWANDSDDEDEDDCEPMSGVEYAPHPIGFFIVLFALAFIAYLVLAGQGIVPQLNELIQMVKEPIQSWLHN